MATARRNAGLIYIEYGFAAGGNLDYLQFWSSVTRCHWLLVCEYWMSPSTFHRTGVHFDNGYRSEGLAYILESVMQHQTAFSLPPDLGRQGLLQISTPTKEESTAAVAALNKAFDHLGVALAEPVKLAQKKALFSLGFYGRPLREKCDEG